MRFLERFTLKKYPLQEAESFSQFYEDTHLYTYRYLMASTGGRQAVAEEGTAEAYLRAWKSRRSFNGDLQAALGWVLTIARRYLIDQYRAQSSRPEEIDLDEEVDPVGPVVDLTDAEAVLLDQELTGALIQALQHLSPARREMVILRYVLGWRVNQIASHLSIPENTVSVTIGRSLVQLQKVLVSQGVSNE